MNPIQQAISAFEEIIAAGKAAKESLDKDIPTGDPVHPVSGRLTWPLSSCLMAVEALRSLQKEVEGVEPRAWMMEWPQHSPSFTTDKSDYVSWDFGKAHYPEALQGLYTADQLHTAIAAALGREAGRPEPAACQACGAPATRHVPSEATEHPGPYCDACGPGATQPTQAQAPGEREALMALFNFMRTAFVPMTPQQQEIQKQLDITAAALATQQAVQGEAYCYVDPVHLAALSTDASVDVVLHKRPTGYADRPLYTTPPAPQQAEQWKLPPLTCPRSNRSDCALFGAKESKHG